jgi:3-hydroxyisobutyrate dehydrogenase-like beta-hydroxyacid dehydrogenase
MVLAKQAGLDPQLTYDVIRAGAGNSRMFEVRAPLMVKADYSKALMKLDVWQKDLTIIGDFAREAGVPTPLFAAAGPLYTAALAQGRDHEDTGAVCAVLEAMAGRKVKAQSLKGKSKPGSKLEGRRRNQRGRR